MSRHRIVKHEREAGRAEKRAQWARRREAIQAATDPSAEGQSPTLWPDAPVLDGGSARTLSRGSDAAD
ncbi:MAG: hypothetical protein ACREFB_18990 [Stellaceae bacterium]